MRRRSKTGGEPVKTRRNTSVKRRSATKAAVRRSAYGVDQVTNVALVVRERDEALEQLSAASEILKVISSSPEDLKAVLEAILANAVRLCDARFATLYLQDNGAFAPAALFGAPPAYAHFLQQRGSFRPAAETSLGRLLRTKDVINIADDAVEPVPSAPSRFGGARTLIIVPMLKKEVLIGAIAIYRQQVQPFTDKQIELVQNFAAQAVIAIGNTRLLNELRQRTDDLSESLEQQTATSEVLRVISSSPGELEPVFQAMLENARRICGAKFGNIYRWDGDRLHLMTAHNVPPAYAAFRKDAPFRPNPNIPTGRMVATKMVTHVADLAAESVYAERDPDAVAGVELGGIRTLLSVPMLKENKLVGAFTIYRDEVRPFTDKQIELVRNFAAQAVIAIENARLLNELRQRTDDLSDSLEQQTATSEVLRVISTSPGELALVFNAMLENATRICQAQFGMLNLYDGSAFRNVAQRNPPAQFAKRLGEIIRPHPESGLARVARNRQIVHIEDLRAGRPYLDGDKAVVEVADLGGARSVLIVPMLSEGKLIGAISIYRQEIQLFADKQIELVKNFAAQAVIAIENARLLKELRERTEEVEKLNNHLEQRVTEQVDEIERMGRLRRFLPPQVADLIVASGAEKQLESHRREITALFCDLRGFTGFSESSDPEDVMALLRDYHAAIGEIIIKYSGTLERYAGDGVMVVFNDPVPVDNPALQAVLMALEMRVGIAALTEKWRRLGHDIGFGIGIAHGFATLGTIGFEGRFDYAAIGTVSNVASRLCDEAQPGQILISPRVLMAVEDAVTVEPIGEFALKGIRRPLAAYNVLDTKSVN